MFGWEASPRWVSVMPCTHNRYTRRLGERNLKALPGLLPLVLRFFNRYTLFWQNENLMHFYTPMLQAWRWQEGGRAMKSDQIYNRQLSVRGKLWTGGSCRLEYWWRCFGNDLPGSVVTLEFFFSGMRKELLEDQSITPLVRPSVRQGLVRYVGLELIETSCEWACR